MSINGSNGYLLDFDEIEWLNTFYGYPNAVQRKKIEKVLLFSLMWNLFESETCGKDFGIAKIAAEIKKLNASGALKREDFSEFLQYFQKRYSDDAKFQALRFG